MSVGAKVRDQLAKRAPKLEETAVRANWRLKNRGRSFSPDEVSDTTLADYLVRLTRDGIVIGSFDELVGDEALFQAAAKRAQALYDAPREEAHAEAGSKATFLTKLTGREFAADDPFVSIATHPRVLQVANGYLRMHSTLRAIELWLTHPTPGDAIQTQLWHRDADDVMNVKLFVYFTNVTRGAGPLTYAPRTHPLGDRRELPEGDHDRRSTDDQMARIVPESDWVVCEGSNATVVLADTCGYHKQLKPTSDERLLVVSHYVSGTPYVPRQLDLQGASAEALNEDQYYAVFDRARG